MAKPKSIRPDLHIDQAEFKKVLLQYYTKRDRESERKLFDGMFTKLCKLVLFKMQVQDTHVMFDDIFNQCLYKCHKAINSRNIPKQIPISYQVCDNKIRINTSKPLKIDRSVNNNIYLKIVNKRKEVGSICLEWSKKSYKTVSTSAHGIISLNDNTVIIKQHLDKITISGTLALNSKTRFSSIRIEYNIVDASRKSRWKMDNNKIETSFSYFYTVIMREALCALKKYHRINTTEVPFSSDEANIDEILYEDMEDNEHH